MDEKREGHERGDERRGEEDMREWMRAEERRRAEEIADDSFWVGEG